MKLNRLPEYFYITNYEFELVPYMYRMTLLNNRFTKRMSTYTFFTEGGLFKLRAWGSR